MNKILTIVICLNFWACKTPPKKPIDFFEYIDFEYIDYYTKKNIVEAPFCKIQIVNEDTFEVNVDYSGKIFLLNHKNIKTQKISETNIKQVLIDNEYFVKIINKEQFLFKETPDFVPDQPCLYYKEDPVYSIYYSGKGNSNLNFIEVTNNPNRINEVINDALMKTISKKIDDLRFKQTIPTKWQGKYHYLDEEGRTAGGDWTGHYTNYRITKDSVHLTTSGHMSGREDYYLAEEKGDTLMLYRYQDIRNNNSLYKQIEQEKLYKKGDTYYFLVNEQEKKGVKVE